MPGVSVKNFAPLVKAAWPDRPMPRGEKNPETVICALPFYPKGFYVLNEISLPFER
jgi:hypothetical protein